MATAGLGSTGPLFFGVGANPPPSSDPSIQELKKKEMKQKGELKVYSADSDVAQSGSRTKTRTKARTVVLDSKYQLGDEVGRGSSGKVYKALNRDTGDFRAIKEIPIRDVPVARLQAVQTEIEVLHTMQHEKIVHYFETIRTDSHLYLVLEYMENGSLAGVVRKYGCFPEALVAMYMRQVLDGLEWLHSHGVCHGDVKGANLLITKEGHVKLADFGVARRLSDATEQGAPSSVVGTPFWMAPEVIQMRHDVPATASDVWSVGCTAIELLTGEPPYFELAPITALYKIVQENQPPFPTGISAELNDFLRKCFTREPEHRATAAQLRQHDWLRPELHAPAAAVDPSATPLAATPPDDARIRDGELHATSRESWGVATRESGHSNSGGGRGGSGGGAAPGRPYPRVVRDSPSDPSLPNRRGSGGVGAARRGARDSSGRGGDGPGSGGASGTNSFGEPVLLHKGSSGATWSHLGQQDARGALGGGIARAVSDPRSQASPKGAPPLRQERSKSGDAGTSTAPTVPSSSTDGAAAAAPSASPPLSGSLASEELSGFLWKRNSGLLSFAYRRRYFYLKDQSLCYRSGATAANAQGEHLSDDQLASMLEKRIPLASVLNVRVHSKVKFEFELVSTTRSLRLRAPSAHALRLWVTTISAEWLQIKHRNTHQAAALRQILEAKEGLRIQAGP